MFATMHKRKILTVYVIILVFGAISMFVLLRYQKEISRLAASIFRDSSQNDKINKEMTSFADELLEFCPSGLCNYQQNHMLPPEAIRPFSVPSIYSTKESTLLVIVFKEASYQAAPLIYSIYARNFAKIKFCGPSESAKSFYEQIEKKFGNKLASEFLPLFLSYQRKNQQIVRKVSETAYFCFNLALEKEAENNSFSGVFVIHEDVVLSYWLVNMAGERFLSKSHSFPIGKITTSRSDETRSYDIDTLAMCDPDKTSVTNCWIPNTLSPKWPEIYRNSTTRFYDELFKLAANKEESHHVYWECLVNITKRTGGRRRVFPGKADAFYIAKRDFSTALALFELAERHRLFKEIAVPTTFACFDPATTDVFTSQHSEDDALYKTKWEAFDSKKLFMHSLELSPLAEQAGILLRFYDQNIFLFYWKTLNIKLFGGKSEVDEQLDANGNEASADDICLYCLLDRYARML